MARFIVSSGIATVLLLGGVGWPMPQAAGQSILKRLEQEIRQRVAEDASATQPAADARSKPKAGYLGAVVDDRQDRGRGVRVLDVRPEGPADVAGLRVGDLITGAAGVRVRQTEDLADVMAVFPAESRLTLDVLRNGQAAKIDIVLGRRDSPADTVLQEPEVVPLPEPRADPIEPAAQPAESPPATRPDPSPARPRIPPPLPRPDTPQPDPQRPAGEPTPEAPAESMDRLHARIAELERRVEQLEQALADVLDRQ